MALTFSIIGLIALSYVFKALYGPYRAVDAQAAQIISSQGATSPESQRILLDRYNELTVRHMELCLVGALWCIVLGSVFYNVHPVFF